MGRHLGRVRLRRDERTAEHKYAECECQRAHGPYFCAIVAGTLTGSENITRPVLSS